MSKRFPLSVAALFLVSICLPAEIVTKKIEWRPVSGIQKVEISSNEIAISEVRFDLGDTVPPVRYSSAKAVVRVDNNSVRDQEVGVAVAVFDASGNMLAAGNGGNKIGELNKGKRQEFTVRFAYVYRNLKDADHFLVSLETKEKGRYQRKKSPPPEQ